MRNRWSWALLVALAALSAGYAWRAFPTAFPLLELDLRMDRGRALAAADSLAAALDLGPATPRSAAVFQGDPAVQTFVELEGGGPERFRNLATGRIVHPYAWEVRRFVPGSPHELRVFFAPDGQPIGFEERLGEGEPGAAIAPDSARALAQRFPLETWGIGLEEWTPLPDALVIRPGGRHDHTFTWDHRSEQLGEGRIRLQLVVAGDRVTSVRRRVEVPEGFTRRYAEIRSANDGIAMAATGAMVVLYGLGGVLIGVTLLSRRQPLHARRAFGWGAALAGVVTASMLAALPFAWMEFDTALDAPTFLLQQVALVVGGFASMVLMFGAALLGGENLARAGFARHPFAWSIFGREAGASRGMLARVAIGILLTPVFLAYAFGFSALSSEWQGWWSPMTPLSDPNLVASPAPWLLIIAGPLQAAVWEEFLFRAVPFGLAALAAERWGGRRGWLAVAMVVQAVVFAAAHADYPAQPGYARLVELLLPSLLFGVLFLRWGLVPAIVLHFEYDLALFALPLLATPALALVGTKALVLLAAVAPLGLLFVRRWQAEAWGPLPDLARNAAHRRLQQPAREPAPPATAARTDAPPIEPTHRIPAFLAIAATGVALLAWNLTTRMPRPPRIEVGRPAAESAARGALAARGITLGDEWSVVSAQAGASGTEHRFVWRVAGADAHASLLGRHLAVPHWGVEFRKYGGDVVDRAEVWRVLVDARGQVMTVEHRLPEAWPGATLDEADARARAAAAIAAAWSLSAASLEPVSAEPTARPARRDWTFTWADTTGPALDGGRLDVTATLAGDEVTRLHRTVHIPEEWRRAERRGAVWRGAPVVLAALALVAVLGVAGIAALAAWPRGRLDRRRVAVVALLTGVPGLIALWNGWPGVRFGLVTEVPLNIQVAMLVGWMLVVGVVMAVGSGLIAGLPLRVTPATPTAPWMPALALGSAVVGARALFGMAARINGPTWGAGGALSDAVPWLGTVVGPVSSLAGLVVVACAALWAFGATAGPSITQRLLRAGLLLAVGWMVVAPPERHPVLALLALATGVGIAAWGRRAVLLQHPAAVPLSAGVVTALGLARDLVLDPWPGSRLATLGGMVALGGAVALLVRLFARTAPPPVGGSEAAVSGSHARL